MSHCTDPELMVIAEQIFNAFDKDKDGLINESELKISLAIDTNNDGVIDSQTQTRTLPDGSVTTWNENEILSRAVAGYIASEKMYGNGDGMISLQELVAMLRSGCE